VASYNEFLTQRGSIFVKNITNFTNIFKTIDFLEGRISLCITHVPKDVEAANVENLVKEIAANQELKDKAKQAFEFAKANIGIFEAPTSE